MAYFRPDKCDRPATKVYCKDCLFFSSKWDQKYQPTNDLCLTKPEETPQIIAASYKEPEHTYIRKSLAPCMRRNAKNNCKFYIKKTFWNKWKYDDKLEQLQDYISTLM